MALVVVCGIPAAGKTTRAQQLAAFVKQKLEGSAIKDVHVIDDPSLGIVKDDYSDRETEKKARGKQLSAVKRLLNPGTVVILDSMAYIKGFRYQLFCEAKAARVTSCVLYVGASKDRATEFNKAMEEQVRWPDTLFDQLVFRFEEPNGMSRWDSPLFIVVPEDDLPSDDIWDVIVNHQPHKPNAATIVKTAVGADYLSTLNDTSTQIVREVYDLHTRSPGAQVVLRGHKLELPYTLTLPQLTRIRRNFVSLNKQTNMPLENIEGFFVQFLASNWDITS